MSKRLIGIAMLSLVVLFTGCTTSMGWKGTLHKRLPEYGHRNWIVVADSAYPKQSAPGIETVYTDASQIVVLKQVVNAIDASSHIQPVIMLDAFFPVNAAKSRSS